MIKRIAIVLLLLAPMPAMAAGYYTYAQWAALPEQLRAVYVAGTFDALVTIAHDEDGAKASRHYAQCVQDAKMDNVQLAENIVKFVSSRPALQTSSVHVAMVLYLIEACGKSP